MAGGIQAGWLNSLAALWNMDGLTVWGAKLVALLIVLLAIAALSSLGKRRAPAPAPGSAPPRRRKAGAAISPASFRQMPPKNKKKKQERLVRRYRPKCVSNTGRPLRRKTAAGLSLVPAAGMVRRGVTMAGSTR